MTDVLIKQTGRVGQITLNRPKALNALNYDMVLQIDAALIKWAKDDAIDLVMIDASGDRAFCAGGDIAELYNKGRAGDYAYGAKFWHDEYTMNARLACYEKPIVSFLQGFIMGGGVGVGCHVSHRIVDESSQIAMPEVGIGLVPDVGGSLLLAKAPGCLGAYLGLTAARMAAGDAIEAGFADHFIPQDKWAEAKATLIQTGSPDCLAAFTTTPPAPALPRAEIDRLFRHESVPEIVEALSNDPSEFAGKTQKSITRNSPLSMACTLSLLQQLKDQDQITQALELEYRFTTRACQHGDFLEGIRAAIIDKDRAPKWKHSMQSLPKAEVEFMLSNLGNDAWTFAAE